MTTTQDKPRGGRLPRKARRAQLLESALEVFVAQGYHAAAMDDIAERAGVSKPVLYQHFPGKLELYLALLEQAVDTIIKATREALASTHDNKQRVLATMEVFYDYVADAQGAFRLVFESDLTNEPLVRAQLDRVTAVCADEIAQVIHEDTALPDPRVPTARRLARRHGPGQRAGVAGRGPHRSPSRKRLGSSQAWPGAASVVSPSPTTRPERGQPSLDRVAAEISRHGHCPHH